MTKRKPIHKYACGFCASAPITKDQHHSHRLCHGESCVCADDNHTPTARVLTAQARWLHMSPEDVKERWPNEPMAPQEETAPPKEDRLDRDAVVEQQTAPVRTVVEPQNTTFASERTSRHSDTSSASECKPRGRRAKL